MQDFPGSRVWHRAHAHAIDVRKAVRSFPRPDFTSLKVQIIRAAESIPANVVEGCGAATRKEFARYVDVSIKSSSELEYQLLLARDNRVLREHDWKRLTAETIEIRRMLCGPRRRLRESD